MNASGIGVGSLVRYATEGRLRLHFTSGLTSGFIIPHADLDQDVELGGADVPLPRHMTESAVATAQPGVLRLSQDDVNAVAPEFLVGNQCQLLFELPARPGSRFAPTGGAFVNRETLSVSAAEVEALRGVLAARITPEQLADAKSVREAVVVNRNAGRLVSEAVAAFMIERAKSCSPDQARRILLAACDVFVELMGDLGCATLIAIRSDQTLPRQR